jgi:hypothetical protein
MQLKKLRTYFKCGLFVDYCCLWMWCDVGIREIAGIVDFSL